MSKLLRNLLFWCVMFLFVAGLLLWSQLSYLNGWLQLDHGYLDVMASSIIVFVISPLFIVAFIIVAFAALKDLPTYIRLLLPEIKLPQISVTTNAPLYEKKR